MQKIGPGYFQGLNLGQNTNKTGRNSRVRLHGSLISIFAPWPNLVAHINIPMLLPRRWSMKRLNGMIETILSQQMTHYLDSPSGVQHPLTFRIQCPLAAFYCAQTCFSKFHLLTPYQTLFAFLVSEPAFHLVHGVGQSKKMVLSAENFRLICKEFWVPFPLGDGVNQAVNFERKGKMDHTALLPVFFRAKKTWAQWLMPLTPAPER